MDHKAANKIDSQARSANLDAFTKKSIQQVREIEAHYAPTEKTSADELEAGRLAAVYYKSLAKSIVVLDDGSSDAITVARAAVSENRNHLIAWKKATLIHWYRNPNLKNEIDTRLGIFPTEHQINDATIMVLRFRNRSFRAN